MAARIAPLLAPQLRRSAGIDWIADLQLELQPWLAATSEVIEALRSVLYQVLGEFRSAGVTAIPIKGSDALLWGLARTGRLHTKDLDILVPEIQLRDAEAVLRNAGFDQYSGVDPAKGIAVRVSAEERERADSKTIETWAWSRFFRTPQLDSHCAAMAALPWQYAFPCRIIRGQAYIEVQIDLHHHMWPAAPVEALTTREVTVGVLPATRLGREDLLVSLACRAYAELQHRRDAGAIGAYIQALSVALAERESLSLSRVLEASSRLGLDSMVLQAIASLAAANAELRQEVGLLQEVPEATVLRQADWLRHLQCSYLAME